jgi:hypothetical protein
MMEVVMHISLIACLVLAVFAFIGLFHHASSGSFKNTLICFGWLCIAICGITLTGNPIFKCTKTETKPIPIVSMVSTNDTLIITYGNMDYTRDATPYKVMTLSDYKYVSRAKSLSLVCIKEFNQFGSILRSKVVPDFIQ